MDNLPDEIRSAINSFAEERSSSPGRHPEISTLVEYHEGRLPYPKSEDLREHLAFCRECSALVLDLARFHQLEPAREEDRLSMANEKRLASALSERIRAADKPPESTVPFLRRRVAAPRLVRTLLAQAAVLLLVLGGFWIWTGHPSSDVDILYLRPDSPRASSTETYQVPSWAKNYLLVLGSIFLEEDTRYILEILKDGNLVVTGTDLHQGRDGTINFRVPRRRLETGVYEIRLYEEGSDDPIETYSLEIAIPE